MRSASTPATSASPLRRGKSSTAGREIATRPCPQVLTAWERVYRVLRDAFPPDRYHRGRSFHAFEQSGGGVIAHFSDGGTRRATC